MDRDARRPHVLVAQVTDSRVITTSNAVGVEDPNQWGCVEFVSVEPKSLADIIGYEAGDHECPPTYSGEGYQGWKGVKKDLNKLGGYLEKGANWAAKAWQDIKAFAIKTLMKVTGAEAPCQFAEDAVLPEGACYDVISAAVDVGLGVHGHPPHAPELRKADG